MTGWWFGLFFSIYWEFHHISSSHLTNSYFSEGLKPPASHGYRYKMLSVSSTRAKLEGFLLHQLRDFVWGFWGPQPVPDRSATGCLDVELYGWHVSPVTRWDRSLQLFWSLLALRSSDIISFTAAISACEGGQWQEALGLLKEMEEMKMTPELMSFLS